MEEKRIFPLFQSHLDLAHSYWKKHLQEGGWAIDATCGNGHDTLFLAKNTAPSDGVIGIDIQEQAIEETRKRIGQDYEHIHLFCLSHETFPPLASKNPISLIVYNLGYLPKADKSKTTRKETTLKSVKRALDLVRPGGLVSITCYPGHSEGKKEEELLINFLSQLHPSRWSVCFHEWKNRNQSPSLFLIQKNTL